MDAPALPPRLEYLGLLMGLSYSPHPSLQQPSPQHFTSSPQHPSSIFQARISLRVWSIASRYITQYPSPHPPPTPSGTSSASGLPGPNEPPQLEYASYALGSASLSKSLSAAAPAAGEGV
ncbi:hypothetical protein BDP27DRAFT_1424759 [Rhodocollybia butyracea]|uniref:Uncharacterized protein n=1 Tax=Rhodocollybia butyracea TaxID=206335 RepID=A0A9P5PP40_9AGAR|nr:hypothetical protein BDP27DRAFT_1425042 [Rhodocollybia butyracea]KAF9065560.1 hypothetical protein BDP27DRAFT_1424759 [Rhodocollybia butyracea]